MLGATRLAWPPPFSFETCNPINYQTHCHTPSFDKPGFIQAAPLGVCTSPARLVIATSCQVWLLPAGCTVFRRLPGQLQAFGCTFGLLVGLTEEKGVEQYLVGGKASSSWTLKHLVKHVLIFQKKERICRWKSLLKTETGMHELLVQTVFVYIFFSPSHFPWK